MSTPIRKIQPMSENPELNRAIAYIQEAARDALEESKASNVSGGIHVKAVVLSSGSNQVAHKLGRRPEGWTITDRNGTATVYRTAWDSKTITLTASAGVTVNLWVF